jgi:hypothetical protein
MDMTPSISCFSLVCTVIDAGEQPLEHSWQQFYRIFLDKFAFRLRATILASLNHSARQIGGGQLGEPEW